MHHSLQRVVYRSDSRVHFQDVQAVDAIFRVSRTNNRRLGITGCLVLADTVFIQVLEGKAPDLGLLMERIREDPRHQNVTALRDWPIQARLFGGWDMARPDPAPLSEQSLHIATQSGTGAQVVGILLGLVQTTCNLYRGL